MTPRCALIAAGLVGAVILTGCGKDSYITDIEQATPQVTVEYGEGIEIITPTDTVAHFFEDYTTVLYQGRPAIALKDLIGDTLVTHPELYGYRLVGVDGFYANQPGKNYGDNTWDQLSIGYLDLRDVRVAFETERDPNLQKGHNIKWLVRAEILRSVDVMWSGGRKSAPVEDLDPETVPDGYEAAGGEGIQLASFVEYVNPQDAAPDQSLYRIRSVSGDELPRLLTWGEMSSAYFLPDEDRVVMPEALGPAYQIDLPRTIRMEAKGR